MAVRSCIPPSGSWESRDGFPGDSHQSLEAETAGICGSEALGIDGCCAIAFTGNLDNNDLMIFIFNVFYSHYERIPTFTCSSRGHQMIAACNFPNRCPLCRSLGSGFLRGLLEAEAGVGPFCSVLAACLALACAKRADAPPPLERRNLADLPVRSPLISLLDNHCKGSANQ